MESEKRNDTKQQSLIDPRVTKRVRNKDNKWIPVPLIMTFVRERGNVIDYQIPISGDLKKPKFHLKDVIFDVLKNIFIKPVTIPYATEVKSVEAEIEKSLTIKWVIRSSGLLQNQKKFLEKIADFLEETPEASIHIYPQLYDAKEREYILFFEAKKKYFLLTNNKNEQSFNEDDAKKVDKMSVKDTVFVNYLNKHFKSNMLFTIQEKCAKFISVALINAKLKQLNTERTSNFLAYFKDKNVEKQVKIFASEKVIPYNGFSFYKIIYKGEFPTSLIKAYKKMNRLDEEEPRKKFKTERKKNRNKL
jgi:hypothetical protein